MIVVTGATGLIGSVLLSELALRGLAVRAICRQPQPPMAGVEWLQGDMLDVAFLEQALAGATHVFHCAGLVSFAPRDSRLLYKINVEGTANVVNICLKNRAVRLCHVSSVAAIGKVPGNNTPDEQVRWEAQQGHSVYAASKHWAEAEVWRGIAEGLQAVIVNPSIVLGGTDHSRSSTRLLKFVAEEHAFYVEGEANFVDVRDVAEAMIGLAFSDISGERFILNAGKMAYLEFFTLAARCFGKKPPHIKVPRPVARTIAWAEHLRSLLTGARPLITPDTVRRTRDQLHYPADKVRQAIGLQFRPLPETIEWACRQVKNNYSGTSQKPALVSP